jgi:hypothetical protein
MKWIEFSNIDDLPKDKCIMVCNLTSIDYIIYDMNNWRFCYSEQIISENLLRTYIKYFVPTL